jgi:5-oxopent-3-ene-1,2,5-tricarboxylate decarboxylase / 2-hydroxyhepta-2,4-diene-1,7-dioate isomerase
MTNDTDSGADALRRPGKLIALHLNYPSRVAERGRRPAKPSYFLKPSTSVAASGGTVERPAGTELLGFEGEIALVIGRTARRVDPIEAWSHVSAVTAANDLGVYDLRLADKGSNLRSKGGDGFTPLGPRMLPAVDLDPSGLRVRTWLNGDLVQDDTTSDLLFPLAELVADLSQLITLEPGDVILTGTPAGASVAVPGDLIEVEVDAPDAAGSPSTGRLSTRVVAGTVPLPEYSAQPQVDDTQRIEAWGSAEKAGIALAASGLDPGLADKLSAVAVATLSSQLKQRGYNEASIDGVHPTAPGARLLGVARTLRFIATRPDLAAEHGGGFNAHKRAIDSLRPGEVLVMEARGLPITGTIGDILALRARVLGAAGVVSDGGIRDLAAVAEIGLPVFSAGGHPAVFGRRHIPWEVDAVITCGGAAVQPGDVIVGDDDGVIVLPYAIADEVADAALAQEREERFIAEQVGAGASVDGLYPMNAEWRSRYSAWSGR